MKFHIISSNWYFFLVCKLVCIYGNHVLRLLSFRLYSFRCFILNKGSTCICYSGFHFKLNPADLFLCRVLQKIMYSDWLFVPYGIKEQHWGQNSMYRTIFGQSFHEPFPLYIYARLDALQMLILPNTAVKLLRQKFFSLYW